MPSSAYAPQAKYTRLTDEEIKGPLEKISDQHLALTTALSELDTSMQTLADYAENNPDTEIAKRYNLYQAMLDKASTNLATTGYNAQTIYDTLGMKRDYSKYIVPAIAAKDAYDAKMKELQDADNKSGNKLVFTDNTRGFSPDMFLYDKNPFYESVNLDDTYAIGLSAGKGVSSRRDVIVNQLGKVLPDYYQYGKVSGFSNSEVFDQLLNNSAKDTLLKKTYDQQWDNYANSIHLDNYSDEDKKRIKDRFLESFIDGISYDIDRHDLAKRDNDGGSGGKDDVINLPELEHEEYVTVDQQEEAKKTHDDLSKHSMGVVVKAKDGSLQYNPDKEEELQERMSPEDPNTDLNQLAIKMYGSASQENRNKVIADLQPVADYYLKTFGEQVSANLDFFWKSITFQELPEDMQAVLKYNNTYVNRGKITNVVNDLMAIKVLDDYRKKFNLPMYGSEGDAEAFNTALKGDHEAYLDRHTKYKYTWGADVATQNQVGQFVMSQIKDNKLPVMKEVGGTGTYEEDKTWWGNNRNVAKFEDYTQFDGIQNVEGKDGKSQTVIILSNPKTREQIFVNAQNGPLAKVHESLQMLQDYRKHAAKNAKEQGMSLDEYLQTDQYYKQLVQAARSVMAYATSKINNLDTSKENKVDTRR